MRLRFSGAVFLLSLLGLVRLSAITPAAPLRGRANQSIGSLTTLVPQTRQPWSIHSRPTAPTLPKFRTHPSRIPNHYIVAFNDSAAGPLGPASRSRLVAAALKATYAISTVHAVFSRAINGAAVEMSEAEAQRLSLDPRVK